MFGKQSLLSWLLMLGAAALGWTLAPTPTPTPEATPEGADSWALPQLPANEQQRWAKVIADRNLWGATSGDPAQVPAAGGGVAGTSRDGDWRVTGIVRRGERAIAVVDDRGNTRFLQQGAALPDGAKIIDMMGNRLQARQADGSRSIGLFGRDVEGSPKDNSVPAALPDARP